MVAAETTDKLQLNGIKYRHWHIQSTVATTGEGLDEGFDWLLSTMGATVDEYRAINYEAGFQPPTS
ncbi:hypothetical protein BDV93DRAFT_557765 [Ceratobasidium sp. AG-I]|nr:hypothetical protein BDV93DRAFT_557765 [Ceratobasidium sp. AG-I]